MQLFIIDELHWYLLDDQTVAELNGQCKSCPKFRQIITGDP
jgi:hypothetical protein